MCKCLVNVQMLGECANVQMCKCENESYICMGNSEDICTFLHSPHLHILTFAHLHIFQAFSHLHILTFAHLHISQAFSHLHILTFAHFPHLHISHICTFPTFAHLHISHISHTFPNHAY